MCFGCLPCFGAAAWSAFKVNKKVEKAFSSKQPQEPTEPAFVTEAKLKWNLAKWKPTGGSGGAPSQPPAEQQRPKRGERWNSRQQSSKQRLAELVDQHKNSSRAGGAAAQPR